jgi:hypothetical protein
MQDLTRLFVKALERRAEWDPRVVARDLTTLLHDMDAYVDWDSGAGEDWISVRNSADELLAFVWTRAPLAFVFPPAAPALDPFLVERGVVVEPVVDWGAPDFSIDRQAVRDAGFPYFWPTGPEDAPTTGFSMLDLWSATV